MKCSIQAARLIVCALIVSGSTSALVAQESPDPKALVTQAGAFLQKQEKFAFNAAFSMKVSSPMMNRENAMNFKVTAERPNRLSMTATSESGGATLMSNGKELSTYVEELKKYVVESAPDSLGDLTETQGGKILMGVPLLSDLFATDPAESLLTGVTSAEYVGREEIEGKPYHHCRFEQEQFDWDVWIAAEGDPVIFKMAPDLAKRIPEELRGNLKMESQLAFTNWNFAPKIDEATFTFTPPEGAEKVDTFLPEAEEEGPHPLLGKVAPPFKLQNLDDKPVDLTRHIGKEIVVLDFWATWCGPCIAAMPEVKATAEKFADKGVVLYFVNLQEDAETINEFLKEQELEVPVVLDTEGAVAAEYGVTGIPQTVIIGKDGKVQVVHVGFSPNLQKQLTGEIESLLAGKDLAAEELSEHEKKAEPQSAEASE